MTQPTNEFFSQVKDLLRAGQEQAARTMLTNFLKQNPNSEQGWWLMSFAVSNPEQQIDCLERVLRINPNRHQAQTRLESLMGEKPSGDPTMQKAASQRQTDQHLEQARGRLSGLGIALLSICILTILGLAGYFGFRMVSDSLDATNVPGMASQPGATQQNTATPTPSPSPQVSETPPAVMGTASPTVSPTPFFDIFTDDGSCKVVAMEGGIALQIAPFPQFYHVLPTMEPGIPYAVTERHEINYHLARDGANVGWVDNLLALLAIESAGDCYSLPEVHKTLEEFPALCTFVVDSVQEAYTDPNLKELHFFEVLPDITYVAELAYNNSYLTSEGHAGPSYFVDATKVQLQADCDQLPRAGRMIADGELWSEPNGESGQKLQLLTADTSVYIQAQKSDGPGPPEISERGEWYYVLIRERGVESVGWVWSTLVSLE